MTEVTLHLYDLSMGMARTMSPLFIGKLIEFIPHTGVVVFGHEYFFSGGIQVLPPHRVVEFSGLPPIERIPMGHTTKTEAELREFLRSVSHRFTAATYDLFRHNCNNFSDTVTQFLLGKSIPDRILRVPAEVLSTPMGAQMAQMMGSMETNLASRAAAAGGSFDPFASMVGGALAPSAPAAAAAGMGEVGAAAPAGAGASAGVPPPSHVLGEHAKPLLSAEPGNLTAILDKVSKINDGWEAGDAEHRFSASDVEVMSTLQPLVSQIVSAPSSDTATVAHFLTASTVLASALRRWPHATGAFPILSLLRMLVLRDDCVPALASEGGALAYTCDVLSKPEMFGGLAANVMALAFVSNSFKTPAGVAWASQPATLPTLISIAVRELRSTQKNMKQMAAALAYNLATSMPVGSDTAGSAQSAAPGDTTVLVTDASVQLLGAMLEDLAAETDVEVLRRRLLGAGRLIQREGPAAGELMQTLGFDEPVLAVARNASLPADLRALASEVSTLLVVPSAY